MYRSIIFFILMGLSVPYFNDYLYYFKTEVTEFSQF